MLQFLLFGGQWVGVRTHTHTKHPKDIVVVHFSSSKSRQSVLGIGKQTPIVRIAVLSQRIGKAHTSSSFRIGIGLISGTIAHAWCLPIKECIWCACMCVCLCSRLMMRLSIKV